MSGRDIAKNFSIFVNYLVLLGKWLLLLLLQSILGLVDLAKWT